MKTPRKLILTFALGALALSISGSAYGQKRQKRVHHARPATVSDDEATDQVLTESGQVRMKMADGTFIVADEASESEQGIWYRQGGMNHLISRDRVKTIDRGGSRPKSEPQVAKVVAADDAAESADSSTVSSDQPVWIYLVGGARVEADSVIESTAGAWYRRGPLSIFVERSRIDHIEREVETLAESNSSKKARGWTTGNLKIDGYIKQSGTKYGVDPYLIFCVMEQESHFNSRALSPKGARGLMQLMPGTSAMLGVKRPSDPAQNIAGGTRYLKQLLQRFDGRIDLVLASYNAGEGAVMKFGRRVPPYQETRNYVKRISFRYRQIKPPAAPAKGSAPIKNEVATVKAAL